MGFCISGKIVNISTISVAESVSVHTEKLFSGRGFHWSLRLLSYLVCRAGVFKSFLQFWMIWNTWLQFTEVSVVSSDTAFFLTTVHVLNLLA